MSYEPYNEATATMTDRVAYALCQIVDDDAPMRWTRWRYVVDCLVTNQQVLQDLNSLRDIQNHKRNPPESRPSMVTREVHFGRGASFTMAPGGYKREPVMRPIEIPDHRGDRLATQKSTVLAVLVDLTNRGLSPSLIEQVRDKLVHEMTDGPTAWAFK